MNSVCLAVYNGGQHIKRQLESIVSQLDSGDEIIISDDGSTDNTLAIINDLADARISVIKNTGKRGPVGNFENALRHAAGEIIFLCDQDDIWLNNKVTEHLLAHSGYDLVVSDAVVIDAGNNILFESFFKARNSRKGIIRNLKANSYIGCCMSFNRSILNAALPFPNNIHMHDWWIGLVAEVKGKVLFLNKPLMQYIRHENNASGTLVKRLPLTQQIRNRLHLIYNLIKLK